MHGNVLLVESDHTLAKYLADLIEKHLGCACHQTSSLDDGVELLAAGGHSLVVVDLDLLDGRDRRRAAELSSTWPEVRFIGLGSLPACSEGVTHAFDTIIHKPFLADPLLAALPPSRPGDLVGQTA